MNRHMRRQARRLGLDKTLAKAQGALSELAPMAALPSQLQPVLEEAAQLANKLGAAQSVIQDFTAENERLRQELQLQRQTFLRMFAHVLSMPLGEVLSMEAQIRESLQAHADSTSGNDTDQRSEADPGA